MIRAAGIVLACSMLVPAAAGTSSTRTPVGLTASPAHVTLAGPGRATVRVTNTGSRPVVVDAARAGFALDLRGRPRVVARGVPGAATPWLTLRPRRLVLRPRASASLTVASKLPRHVEPGDHDALVLLTTRPLRAARVAVRMRIGIVVVVRAPGRILHRIELHELRVRRASRARTLELLIVNRGNVTEELGRDRILLTLVRRGQAYARLRPAARELRPRTRGIMQFTYRGRLRGWVTARITVSSGGNGVTRRTFRIRL